MEIVELTPMLTVKDARGVVEFYKEAFDAKEISRQSTPTGQFIIELSIGEARFYVVDENRSAFNVIRGSLPLGTLSSMASTSMPCHQSSPKSNQ